MKEVASGVLVGSLREVRRGAWGQLVKEGKCSNLPKGSTEQTLFFSIIFCLIYNEAAKVNMRYYLRKITQADRFLYIWESVILNWYKHKRYYIVSSGWRLLIENKSKNEFIYYLGCQTENLTYNTKLARIFTIFNWKLSSWNLHKNLLKLLRLQKWHTVMSEKKNIAYRRDMFFS